MEQSLRNIRDVLMLTIRQLEALLKTPAGSEELCQSLGGLYVAIKEIDSVLDAI